MKQKYILRVMMALAATLILLAACGEPNRTPLTPTATGARSVTTPPALATPPPGSTTITTR